MSIIKDSFKCIVNKEELLMKVLMKYYNEPENLNKLLPILLDKTKLSLRVLDHFVTNYSKNKKIAYYLDKSNKITDNPKLAQPFLVYLQYKSQLKSYKKDRFDPFRRGERISFCYDTTNDLYIETTVGQLNFFKWAINNAVIDYVIDHLDDIETDMERFTKRSERKRRNTKKRSNDKSDSKESNSDNNNSDNNDESLYSKMPVPISASKIETEKHTKIIVSFGKGKGKIENKNNIYEN
jgi:hypothetical protein